MHVFDNKYNENNHISHNAEQNITSAHEKIAECKKDILRAKRIRKNRQGKISSVFQMDLGNYLLLVFFCVNWERLQTMLEV